MSLGWGGGTWGSNGWGGAFEIAGNSASGAVGAATPGITIALTGNAANGAVGTVSRGDTSLSLTGVEALGGDPILLTGVEALGEVGAVGFVIGVELSGVSASGAADSMSLEPRSFALTGNYAAGDVGVVVAVYWKLIDDMQNANWVEIAT